MSRRFIPSFAGLMVLTSMSRFFLGLYSNLVSVR